MVKRVWILPIGFIPSKQHKPINALSVNWHLKKIKIYRVFVLFLKPGIGHEKE